MRRRTMIVALVALSAGACAANPSSEFATRADPDAMAILVQNETPHSLRVSMIDPSGERLLGRVEALSERTFNLPPHMSEVVQLVARPPVGIFPDRAHVSEPITLIPGHLVTWELRPSPMATDVPRMSIVRIYACSAGGC